jgi:hypothetical protein
MEFVDPSPSNTRGGFVAYGLGDFLSAAEGGTVRSGCILNVTFEKHRDDVSLTTVNYTPTYSVEPSEDLASERYEVLDSLAAISFYERAYYDRVSEALYQQLLQSVKAMAEQTGAGGLQITR